MGQGLRLLRAVRIHPLLPHQPGHWHEGLRPRGPPRMDQGGSGQAQGQVRGARCPAPCTKGESGGQTGHTYDISNKHRLGYSEVQLVQTMIDGVNTLWKEDLELQ